MKSMFDIEKLGSSLDDAWWEAFDKAAKMMWLEYPGWPVISRLSSEYEKSGWKSTWLFPRVWLVKREMNFSFSGLKSSVKREVDKRKELNWELTLEDQKEISFEFENAVTEVMAWKIIEAAKQKRVKTVMLAGWVSANNKLKEVILKFSKKENLKFIFPVKNLYCMDNAAMVWINTYYKIKYWKFEEKVGVVKI